jgi:hypothetical protein
MDVYVSGKKVDILKFEPTRESINLVFKNVTNDSSLNNLINESAVTLFIRKYCMKKTSTYYKSYQYVDTSNPGYSMYIAKCDLSKTISGRGDYITSDTKPNKFTHTNTLLYEEVDKGSTKNDKNMYLLLLNNKETNTHSLCIYVDEHLEIIYFDDLSELENIIYSCIKPSHTYICFTYLLYKIINFGKYVSCFESFDTLTKDQYIEHFKNYEKNIRQLNKILEIDILADDYHSHTPIQYISQYLDKLNFTNIKHHMIGVQNISLYTDFNRDIPIKNDIDMLMENMSQIDMNSMYPAFAVAAECIMKYCKTLDLNYCRFPKTNAIPTVYCKVYIPTHNELALYVVEQREVFTDLDDILNLNSCYICTYVFDEGDWQYGVEYKDVIMQLYLLRKENTGPFKSFVKQILVCWFGKMLSLKLGYDPLFIYAYSKAFMIKFTPVTDTGCSTIVDSLIMKKCDLDKLMEMYPYMFGSDIGQFKIEIENKKLYYYSFSSYMFMTENDNIIKSRGNIRHHIDEMREIIHPELEFY